MTEKLPLDPETERSLAELVQKEQGKTKRVDGVRTVLIVLSARGMVLDVESMRQKVSLVYPDAAVFIETTMGSALGVPAPEKVDLLIDLTGPGQRQGLFYARKLRRIARYAVGRNAGLFRKKIYDRLIDEKARKGEFPEDLLAREREVQKQVLALVGVAVFPMGDTPADRGKTIALELPPYQKL